MVVLLALLVTCSGCVVWYKDFPRPAVTAGQQGTTDVTLPAHPGFEQCVFRTGFSQLDLYSDAVYYRLFSLTGVTSPFYPFYPSHRNEISSWYVLHSDSLNMNVPVQGGKVVFMSDLSEAGMMPKKRFVCEARVVFSSEWNPIRLTGIPAAMTVFFFPMLGLPDTVQYSVTFVVSNPQGLTREYHYNFRKAGISWAALLPFAWINFFTSSEQEAFQAVFQQFLFDFQRDRATTLPERQSQTR
jgi:hypothetical protein